MHPYLNIAVRAARRAGTIITRHYEQLDPQAVAEKGMNDWVTHVDKSCEEAIIDTITKAYPHHSILGEESGFHDGNEFEWIIDPLDGTFNFVHGFPQFAVSIGISQKGQLEHGVIYDPISQDLYTATRGGGAQLNNRRIRVSNRESLNGALIGTGFPFQSFNQNKSGIQHFSILQSMTNKGADLRRIGCASLNLAYTAAGRLDAYLETDLKIWDIAAGVLLVKEAGGYVTDFEGGNDYLETGHIIAGARKVQMELSQIAQSDS